MYLFVGQELSWSLELLGAARMIAREWLIMSMNMLVVSDTIGKRGTKWQC